MYNNIAVKNFPGELYAEWFARTVLWGDFSLRTFSISSGNYFLPIHCGSPDMANNSGPISLNNPDIKFKEYYGNNIKNSNNNQYSKKLKFNKLLNSYLAGLFEGDGHIWIPKTNLKKKHNPRFCITFSLKNEPLAKKIIKSNRFRFYKIQN